MNLTYIPYISKEERAALKPKSGDTVLYEGEKYIIKEMGLRYLNAVRASTPGVVYMLKASEVMKYVEPTAEEAERGPQAGDIAFDFLR